MADSISQIALWVGGAIASKNTVERLLGPTADYLGEGTKKIAEKCAANLGHIFKIACEKVQQQLVEDGGVSPRQKGRRLPGVR